MKVIILVLVLIISAYSAKLRRVSVNPLPQLNELKEKSSYSRNLVNTLELHLTSGGKVEEVITYVKEALANTQNQKAKLSAEFGDEMEKYEGEVASQGRAISDMDSELGDTIKEIADTQADINALGQQEDKVSNEVKKLGEREQNIREARDNDIKSFTNRQKRHNNAINGLGQILPLLEDMVLGGAELVQTSQQKLFEFIETQQKDKIIELVSLSMQLNKAKLKSVIQKLEKVLEAAIAAKKLDEENEAESKIKFQALIAEMVTLKGTIAKQLKLVRAQQTTKESGLTAARASKQRLELNIKSSTALKAQTQETKDTSEENFKRKISDADQAIQALQDALNILEEGADDLNKAGQKVQA